MARGRVCVHPGHEPPDLGLAPTPSSSRASRMLTLHRTTQSLPANYLRSHFPPEVIDNVTTWASLGKARQKGRRAVSRTFSPRYKKLSHKRPKYERVQYSLQSNGWFPQGCLKTWAPTQAFVWRIRMMLQKSSAVWDIRYTLLPCLPESLPVPWACERIRAPSSSWRLLSQRKQRQSLYLAFSPSSALASLCTWWQKDPNS
eukprot:6481292-Amphidinium_carterae.1